MRNRLTRKQMHAGAKYWANKGRYQKDADRLQEKLIPLEGPSSKEHGELLRAITKFYYDRHNNGDCNIDLPHFRKLAAMLTCERTLRLFQPYAVKLKVKDLERLMKLVTTGNGTAKDFDLAVDVVVRYCKAVDAAEVAKEAQLQLAQHVVDLVGGVNWLLDFLANHPPHDSSGNSMYTDMSAGIEDLNATVGKVTAHLDGTKTRAKAVK